MAGKDIGEAASAGFPPVEDADARILILGSLPGVRSIAEQQYYAHPRNAFWPIMNHLFGIEGDYASRCTQLTAQRIALWDVLASSVRPGSLDADIRLDSACVNDFETFFAQHPDIELIAFNGRKAEQLYARFVTAEAMREDAVKISLPSTSPAYAGMPLSGKLTAWRAALCRG